MTDEKASDLFFFFNDTATTEIYTLSLHDALPICRLQDSAHGACCRIAVVQRGIELQHELAEDVLRANQDRKSTRLNSSHTVISYAVFFFEQRILRPVIGVGRATDRCPARRQVGEP